MCKSYAEIAMEGIREGAEIPGNFKSLFRHDQEYCSFVFNKRFGINFTVKAQYLFT